MNLSDEQRTKVRETVLSGRDVPRVDRVNFEIEVGRPVPREVRIREVPTTLVEIYPEWRGHEYFVVNDEIVIVDRSRRIVSRVPVGSSSASVEHRGSSRKLRARAWKSPTAPRKSVASRKSSSRGASTRVARTAS